MRDPARTGGDVTAVVRHGEHDPSLPCRPAGNGLCEPLSPELVAEICEALEATARGETTDLGDFSQYAGDEAE